ncbi:hypothetical protein Pint_24965 [Pistacia integerrima]|uniref:Uncharacterized protein n=1 Tax=Pistacia integerrima TaxID=434235 RepID=A0ACC0YD79_9ROSI|nr:hypothetical protein Pint_24965 [Pistacia integerrima]
MAPLQNSFALSKHCLLSRNQLSSASSISSWAHLYEVKYCNYQLRTIRTFPPVCMRRRSCKIAGRKFSEYAFNAGGSRCKKGKIVLKDGKGSHICIS